MPQTLRVAVIGGSGHQSLTSAFGKTARCVAIAADGLDEGAKAYLSLPWAADAPYFGDWRKMLDEVKPEVISLGAWPARNAEYILAALNRGMHVVSDKPIATTPEELGQIHDALRNSPNLHMMTEFTMRAAPIYMAARDAVRSGKVGDVALVTAQKSYRFGSSRPDYYRKRSSFPGTIMYVGCHVIDLAYWITGLKYTAAVAGLQGNIARREYGEFEDHAIIMLKMEKGVDVSMNMDYLRPATAPTHGDDRIRIAGSMGVIECRDDKCVIITQDQPPTELASGGHAIEPGLEMVETLRGRGRGIYSTADSLYIAGVLIKARECADAGKCLEIA